MGKLLQVGRKLAVLGVVREDPRLWHIMQPGSFAAPQTQANEYYAHGRSLCGRLVETNGYPQDFTPPDGALCPACSERL